jgi:hypothetical protein
MKVWLDFNPPNSLFTVTPLIAISIIGPLTSRQVRICRLLLEVLHVIDQPGGEATGQ